MPSLDPDSRIRHRSLLTGAVLLHCLTEQVPRLPEIRLGCPLSLCERHVALPRQIYQVLVLRRVRPPPSSELRIIGA